MQRIGRYRLGRVLGHGGAGVVYASELALADGSRRPVALKVLHTGGASIRREARIGGLLRHRNLVDVYELGDQDGIAYCAMERCDGAIGDHLPLPPRAVIDVGLQVCDALQYAHEELGLVHLDLKPQNLLFVGAVVKVADLGIAAAQGFGGERAARGTRGYMAPEQAQGRLVDARADVYALARTLVELATAAPPSAAETVDLDGPSGPLSDDLGPPDWLAPAVVAALAEEPDDRPESMAALAELLRALSVDGPGLAAALGVLDEGPVEPSVAGADNRFVGRERERASLRERLERPGTIGLRGPPGIGKSRLVGLVAEDWTDGRAAWRVELADARDVGALCLAVGRALGKGLGPDPVEAIGTELRRWGSALLILDNADGVSEVGDLARLWCERAPALRIAITARASVPGVDAIELGPLDPEAGVELLVARAAERGAEIEGDPAVGALVGRLDGIPLAIELAAGRIGVLSVAEVLERLGLSMLRRGTADRHGTLREALDWSWSMLDADERRALASLTVFVESFSLAAAQHVLSLPRDRAVEVVSALVDRSLVRVLEGGRFGLLATISEFAAEHLEDRGAAVRHGTWFAAGVLGPPLPADRGRLVRDVPNRFAASWRAIERADVDVAGRCALHVWHLLTMTGPYREIGELVAAVCELPDLGPDERVQLLGGLGVCEYRMGEVDRALDTMLRAVRAAEAVGNPWRAARVKVNLGGMYADLGRRPEALDCYATALDVLRDSGDEGALSVLMTNLAVLRNDAGEVEAARRLFQDVLVRVQRRGDRVAEGIVVRNLAACEFRSGRVELSHQLYERSLALARETHNRRGESQAWQSLGVLPRMCGDLERARAAFAASAEIAREVGDAALQAMAQGNLGHVHRDAGRMDEAVQAYRVALRLARESDQPRFEGHWLAQLAATDPREERIELLDRALALVQSVDDPTFRGWHYTARAAFHARRGEIAQARSALEQAGRVHPLDPDLVREIERVERMLP